MRKQIGIWCVVVLGMRVGCGEHVVSRSLHRYKELAAECVNVAQQTSSARDKAVLLQMAETWLKLAEKASKSEGT